MKMLRGCCCSSLVLGIAILTSASSIIPHQTDEESLKSALDAVTRKQRSLDFSPRDYYNDLRNFNYHPSVAENEEKFTRQQNQELDDNDEDLEFLPLENGQLENIGGGYQNFNNKRLEGALLDYFENSSGQRETAPSSFRERERTGGNKRALTNDRQTSNNDPDKDLAALLYKELQKRPLYGNNKMTDLDNQDYLLSDTLQSYYDKYLGEEAKLDRNNKLYETNSDPMSWGEIFSKQETLRNRDGNKKIMESGNNDEDDNEGAINDDFVNRERDRDSMYLLPAERRNVNGRYPLGREYGVLLKRYPLTKRSPKPMHHDKEPSGVITDTKVAKDLGAVFGSKKATESKNNRTDVKSLSSEKNDHPDHDHDHHDHHHDYSKDHDHDRDHDHGKDHYAHDNSHHDHDHSGHDHDQSDYEHDKPTTTFSAQQRDLEATSSESPRSLVSSPKSTPGQKEITNASSNNNNSNKNRSSKLLSKRDHRNVELTKKSVDWSQYFGIDRRKKKAALLARPGSQDQDDEWLLQRYYKIMADNLKSPDKDSSPDKENGEKRDKLDQMDTRLKGVKNLIVQDALKYCNEENSDSQEVKDVVMARLAAAYSLEKMRRALNEFRSNIAAQRDLMRATHAKSSNNETNNFRDGRDDGENSNDNEKRSGHEIDNDEINPYEGRNDEGFDEGRGCPAMDNIVSRCPRLGNINAVQEACIMYQICGACDDEEEDCFSIFAFEVEKICEELPQPSRRYCTHAIVSRWSKQPSSMAVAACHSGPDSCLRRSYRYRHRGVYYQNGWLPHVATHGSQLGRR